VSATSIAAMRLPHRGAPGWRTPRRFGAVNWVGMWTLYRREVWRPLKEYRDTLLGPAVSSILFLAVFDLALSAVGAGVHARLGGVAVLQFLGPGLIVFAACNRAFETAAGSLIYDKMEGMIQDTLMAPLTPGERTVGYALSAATSGLLAGLVVAAAVSVFVDLPVLAPAALLLFAFGGALMHAFVGIIVGLWATRWEHFAAALTFAVIPLAYLSGTFYPVGLLPQLGQRLVALNPVFYVIDGVRYGFTGTAESALLVGLLVVLGVNVGLAGIAQRLISRGYGVKA
jgi:ABC-2 type transport system permease protein